MAPDPWIGRTCAGWTIERLLGRGGMGAAYLAHGQGRQVVLKLLAPELVRNDALRARFLREADALRRLPPHPNLVRFEGALTLEDGTPCLAMELVEGTTLAATIEGRGRLGPREAALLAVELARGLEALHAHGVVHRDVKPGNVVLRPDGRAVLVDLGLAKELGRRTALTLPGQVLGTASYMAPEQWRGDPPDARTDVFGWGATLYHALVGVAPFEGQDLGEIADQAETGDFPLPRDAWDDIPVELEQVVVRALMPEPAWRHASAAECALDVEGVLAGGPSRTPCLVGPGGRRHALLPELRYTLGRDPGCDVVVDDPSVSRRHAQVTREQDGFVVSDLRSTTGTFVDDVRVESPRPLRRGDRLRLGRVELELT